MDPADESPEDEDSSEETKLLPVRAPRTHARLTWEDSEGEHTVTLRDRILVGSAPKAGLVIADRAVSRIHAELEPREDGAWVRDLGSRNGVQVERIVVTLARIPDGGRVRIGATDLLVKYAAADDEVDLWKELRFGPLVGKSEASRRLFAYLARIAPTDSSVLIEGETGTGKELVAQAIHGASPRASKPFVIIDCAALPENLIESELFGHTKGAFTGAATAREGAIEAADGGTVFLDEIGEVPLALQPRLLRVLESGTIRRVGETQRRKVDVRFISATHRDLRTMVNAGAFREDLYFRLAVLPAIVPPLRDRLDDIPLLVQHFLPGGFIASPEELRQLAKRPWLGNVRELRNFVLRAVALGTKEAMAIPFERDARPGSHTVIPPSPTASLVPAAVMASAPPAVFSPSGIVPSQSSFDTDYKTFREQWIDAGEQEYVRRLLERTNRNVPAAAREAGVDRTYMYRLIRKHAL